MEIFSPYSRQYTLFLNRFLKFYIKNSFSSNNFLDIELLRDIFPSINDHNLRRQIKLMGGEEDVNNKRYFY